MLGRDEEVGWLIFSPMICMLLQASLVDINLTTTFWHFQRPSNKWLHGQRTTRTAGLRVGLGLNKRALFFHWECKRWFEQYFNICTKRNNANYNYNVNVCLIPQCYSNWSFDKLQVHKVIFNVVNVSYFRGPVCLTEKDEANPIFK